LTSASVAGIVPQPLHWNRPPQSPVWQRPTPWRLNTQPVRPQNRVFRLFGVLMVTLRPGLSTQPVAASGVLGSGAAATQIVCDISLTNVTRRRGPVAAAAVTGAAVTGAAVICEASAESGRGVRDAGAPVIRTTAGAAAAAAEDSAAVPLAACCVALAPPPCAAQPAATVTAASIAAVPTALVISAPVDRPRRRLPFPLNITGILPAFVRSLLGDGWRRGG
jgi:hypothetical protein